MYLHNSLYYSHRECWLLYIVWLNILISEINADETAKLIFGEKNIFLFSQIYIFISYNQNIESYYSIICNLNGFHRRVRKFLIGKNSTKLKGILLFT